MKKILIYGAIFVLLVLVSVSIVSASSFEKQFSGDVTKTKNVDIQNLESQGYVCEVPGTTIDIKPKKPKYPRSYLIPTNVRSETGNSVQVNQLIMGKYQGKTSIVCVREYPPSTQTVNLDTITFFGNSKF